MNKFPLSFARMTVLLIGLIIILIGCDDASEVSSEKNDEEINNEQEEINDEVEDDEEDVEDSDSTNVNSIDAALQKRFTSYEEEGEACKSIDDMVERGDCFVDVNANYLNWYLDETKDWFYFPYQREQTHWEDVLYFNIDESDQLGEVQKTDYYEEYMEEHFYNTRAYQAEEIVQDYWYVFSNIIPREYRQHLKQLYWTDTGEDHVFAVGRDRDDMKDSILLFAHTIDKYSTETKRMLIHEFAHILTLNDDQVKVDSTLYEEDDYEELLAAIEEECETYFFTMGCVEESSYINNYYTQFWEDIIDDYNEIDWDSENMYEDFFFENEERFFNSYQGTNPREDIAEAFTFYVMLNSEELEGQEEMKYDKVAFFYQYDELVELRAMILENLYDLSVKDGEFY